MDTAELDKRDRANLYKEGADNVFVLTATPDQIDDPDDDIQSVFVDAVEHMIQTGQLVSYVVIRIDRR